MKPSITHAIVNNRLGKACAFVVVGLLATQVHADEAALYGPTAPKGSAFVRVYNAGSQEINANVGTAKLSEVGPWGAATSVSPGGDYTAQVGSQSLPVKLAADHYYTIVAVPGGQPKLVEEPPFKNKQKALVRVQNLSDTKVTPKTADGKTPVVPDVAPSARGDREINPVNVKLALFNGTQKISDLKPVSLARGEAVALYVTGSGSKLSPVWVKRPAATE